MHRKARSLYIFSALSEDDAAFMRFGNARELLGIKNDKAFIRVLSSSTCLSTIALSTKLEDVSNLVDFISNIKVKNKYLMVQTPTLNTTLLKSKKINFNVMINEVDSGMKQLEKLHSQLSHKKIILPQMEMPRQHLYAQF